jgi:site-specific DNA-methyltransferase (adenine-specific)
MQSSVQYNPDILTCLANLSSDEVFTPPQLANQMLDLLPAEIWKSKDTKFLDPFTKSGVFLREIARRLNEGLEAQIPDRQKRIDHILKNQVFGIAITEITSLLARRSLYCSKKADGKYSVAGSLNTPEGNIRFKRLKHTWQSDRCKWCGASKSEYDRDLSLETHAYEFIHTETPEKLFNMRFDVIVGNPPYQLGSDGGTRDIPIYNRFVLQAKKLNPRYLTMIIPSRWMTSGLGLSEFRQDMLSDRHIRALTDFPTASEVFPGVEIKGGVCYFLWCRDEEGDCLVTTIRGNEKVGPISRNLSEFDVLVRDTQAVTILRKVLSHAEPSLIDILAVDKEFGWTSNFSAYRDKEKPGDIPIYYINRSSRGRGWISRTKVLKSSHLIDTWKTMIPQAYGAGETIPHQILGQPFVAPNPSVCTQSYLFVHTKSKTAAQSVESYIRTRFVRFLVSLRKITQHATRSTYTWVPQQKWDRMWKDEDLYRKYGITQKEISFIESRVKVMKGGDED